MGRGFSGALSRLLSSGPEVHVCGLPALLAVVAVDGDGVPGVGVRHEPGRGQVSRIGANLNRASLAQDRGAARDASRRREAIVECASEERVVGAAEAGEG